VMDDLGPRLAPRDGRLQGCEHERRVQRGAARPADDAATPTIEDRRDIQPACKRPAECLSVRS
jgi:hypothetical protein